jgi:transposase
MDAANAKRKSTVLALLNTLFCLTVAKRLICVILVAFGVDKTVAAERVGVSVKSVNKYLALLDSERPEDLLAIKGKRRKSELDDCKEEIFAELESKNYSTLRSIKAMIEKTTGITRSRSAIDVFLKKNGYNKLSCTLVPSKADPVAQREFNDLILQPLMKAALSGIASLYFLDASHFVRGGFPGAVWSKTRRIVRSAEGRMRYNVLGALNFVTKKVETVTNVGYVNAETVIGMLEKLAAKHASPHTFVVLDNARYQRCKKVTERAAELGIALVFLPSYSPNLNLIERLWKFVKGEVLDAAYHETFEEFQRVIDETIASTDNVNKNRMETLIGRKVQLFDAA